MSAEPLQRIEGELQAVPRSGPWSSDMTADLLYPVAEALLRSGKDRVDPLERALRRGPVNDLRLLSPLLDALGDSYGDLADRVAARAVPGFGAAVLPELRAAFSLKGKARERRVFVALVQLDPKGGVELWRSAWREGSPLLRAEAMSSVPPGLPRKEVERAAVELSRHDSQPKVRLAAVEALARSGSPSSAAVTALVAAMSDPDFHVSHAACQAVGKIGRPALPAVAEALKNPAENVRQPATWMLTRWANQLEEWPEAEAVIPTLIEALCDPAQYIPRNACGILVHFGEKARSAIPALRKALDAENPSTASAAACALLRLGHKGDRCLDRLIAALKTDHFQVRHEAAGHLGQLGRKAVRAAPALAEALRHRDPTLKRLAADALAAVGPPEGVRALAEALAESDDSVSWQAAVSLGSLGPKARAAVPALERALGHANPGVRRAVAEALHSCRRGT